MTLRTTHRLSALVIGLFVTLHLLNHLVLAVGTDMHIQMMKLLRTVYRFPFVEVVLIGAIAFQIYSGVRFTVNRIRQQKKDRWLWLQILSGAYLVYFFINHIGATLLTRNVVGLDTNIYFATVGFYVPPFQFFFYPYYFLAVSAFFIHIACGVRVMQMRKRDVIRYPWLPSLLIVAGPALGAVIVAAQGGAFHDIAIPGEYFQAFQKVFR